MSAPQSPVNRTLTGILSLVCLASGVAVAVADSAENLWCGSFIRTGLVLGALWLALQTKGRAAAWANVSPLWFVALAGLLLVMVRRPLILIPIVMAIVFLIAFLPHGSRRK